MMFTLACAEQDVAANGYDNGWNGAEGAEGIMVLKSGAARCRYVGVNTLLVSKGSSSFTSWRKFDVWKGLSKGSSHTFGIGSARVRTSLGSNPRSFEEDPSCDFAFSLSRTDDKLTTGFTKSPCTCESRRNRLGWAFWSCDTDGDDKISPGSAALLDFRIVELETNGFDRLTELLWVRGWEEEENRICFTEKTLHGFVMAVLGGGPCRKCPLHAGLKLSKLRTGFNWKWCMNKSLLSLLARNQLVTSHGTSKLY